MKYLDTDIKNETRINIFKIKLAKWIKENIKL